MISTFGPDQIEERAAVVLDPLITHLRRYDDARLKLENRGGDLSDVRSMEEILKKGIAIQDRFGDENCASLDKPDLLHRMLMLAGSFDVRLSIRQTQSYLPSYFLCRIHQDFWSEYSLIVEDLYCSPGYPFIDDRFVKLMYAGHERYHLRLSPFRKNIEKMLISQNEFSEQKVDEVLYNAGRHIYRAAWHEDQLPAVLVASHFSLPKFRQAVELLYLTLTAELCELRNVADENLLQFFDTVDSQPAITALLRLLPDLEGSAMNQIQEKALKLYCKLTAAFSHFLQTEISWGKPELRIQLYKLVFANFSRLKMVSCSLNRSDTLKKASIQLEAESEAIIQQILNR